MELQILNEDLIRKAQLGDEEALFECIEKNRPLVAALLKRYLIKQEDKEDLLSIGTLGLIKAIQQFNFDYNTKFSTYAVPLILGEIRKHFRENGLIKISRKNQEIYREIKCIESKLESELGRNITIQDIKENSSFQEDEIILAIEAHQALDVVSINNPYNDSNLCPLDLIGTEEKEKILNNIDLNYALSKLNNKERLFIKLRYFDEIRQDELAKRFHVSQVQVSRFEKKVILKLRNLIT